MKKLFDEKGRLFGKFSVLDIIAVFMVLALAFAVIWRFSKTERYVDMGPVESGVEYTYDFRINGVRQFTADAIRIGDEFYSNTNQILGTVVAKEVEDSYEISETAGGEIVRVRNPERVDITLKLKTKGEIRGGTYYSDGAAISANYGMSVHSKYVATGGTVWSIDK